jgi:hypothetical protein
MARPAGSFDGIAPVDGYPAPEHAEAAFLAGFLEAEACFSVRKLAGAGYGCGCSVAVRRDDRQLLESLCRSFSLGSVRDLPARANSRPQARWDIYRKADCEQLIRVLEPQRLRGRKGLECEVWASAVKDWVGNDPGTRRLHRDWTFLSRCHTELGRLKRYVPRLGFIVSPTPGWEAYVAGFLTGEVYLGIIPVRSDRGWRLQMTVRTRADDLPLLQELQALTHAGTVHLSRPSTGNPVSCWSISARADQEQMVSLLDQNGLRGRKRQEYEIWRAALFADRACERTELAERLQRTREYAST